MALTPVVTTLLALGSALVVAFLASAAFRATNVPDILFLLTTGAILGPLAGILDVEALRGIMPLVGAVAVITILFDGALEVSPENLKAHGWPALRLSATVALTTTLLCAAIAHAVAGLPWTTSLLLGLCFGGAGIAIIVPLAKTLGISGGGMTVLLLEAVTSDILVIVGMSIAATVVASGILGVSLATSLLFTVAIAAAVGLATGALWSRFLIRWGKSTNAYTATLAVLLLVYAATEAFEGSGALAVLIFGILVGNASAANLAGEARRSRVFGAELIEFHTEIVFFVRAIFFVTMGAVTDWTLLAEPRFLLTGLLMSAAVGACRFGGVMVVLRRSGLPRWDKVAVGVLFPMGLVTAAVSVVPRSFGLPDGDLIVDYAAVVIVLTNLLATLAVFAGSAYRGRATAPPGSLPP